MDVAKLKQMVDELGELLKRSNAQYEEMRRIVDGEAGEIEIEPLRHALSNSQQERIDSMMELEASPRRVDLIAMTILEARLSRLDKLEDSDVEGAIKKSYSQAYAHFGLKTKPGMDGGKAT